ERCRRSPGPVVRRRGGLRRGPGYDRAKLPRTARAHPWRARGAAFTKRVAQAAARRYSVTHPRQLTGRTRASSLRMSKPVPATPVVPIVLFVAALLFSEIGRASCREIVG